MPEENQKNTLVAHQFRNDPQVVQAKKIIIDRLRVYQQQITEIKPPQQELVQSYRELLSTFNQLRGGNLYFPYLGSGFGNGALVELLDGSVKYDMISGIGPHYWGHSHPDLTNELLEALLNNTVMQGHLQQNVETVKFAQLLTNASGLDHCFFSSSGAMANENALKIIFQKKFPIHRLLAFENCFMGRSLALSQITDKPLFREGLPHNLHVDYLPFYDPSRPSESIQSTLSILKRLLRRHPNQYAVCCFELVQGEAGFNAGTEEFFKAIMQELKQHEIAIFVDEVQTFGRTSRLFAFQHFHLENYVDVVSIGKLSQVCATLFKNEFKPKPGLLSQTFTSSTSAIYAGYYIVQQLLNGHFFGSQGKIEQIHSQFLYHFQELEKKYPERIKGPYGVGTMIAFTPFGGENERVNRFVQDLFEAGVISFVAGSQPTRVRFLVPAGVLSHRDIDQVMEIVEKVLIKPL